MNICLISREYPTDDHAGGIGTYTEKTARGLARLGQTVYVITQAVAEPSIQRENGVIVVRLLPNEGRGRLVSRARAVARAIEDLPCVPDIVQASEYRAEAFWYALCRHPHTKLVTRLATPSFLVQDLNGPNGVSRNWRLRSRYYFDPLERLQARRSDAVISLTDALADVVCRRWHIPRQKVRTIVNGVDFAERYAPRAEGLPAELRGKDYLIYFGRLEIRKGVHVLAQALPAVLTAHPELHVVFAGQDMPYEQGQSMQEFVEQCNRPFLDRLHFYPRLPQKKLYPILADARFAVLPSLWEALGNVSLEALDMGRPVVATLGCGFGEVVENGRSGLLVPPGDVSALQQAMMTLLADRERLAVMSTAAKARAECFSLDRMTRKLLHFYESLCDPQGSMTTVGSAMGGTTTTMNDVC